MSKKKSKPKFRNRTFKPGTVVVFDPDSFNPEYWNNESEKNKLKYYGPLGYGQDGLKRFVFICEIRNAPGHCVLISLNDQKIETMRHTDDFREVTEEEM
jgi:hypothetical protein